MTKPGGVRYAFGMSRPSLPTSPTPLKPGPATPGGNEPFTPSHGTGEPPIAITPPDSSSGNADYTLVVVMDDTQNTAPMDDDGTVTGVGYQS